MASIIMVQRLIYLGALVTCMYSGIYSTKCGYESCPQEKPGMINVHLIPHTHDDVGWIITVDEYYYKEVQFIIDTVISELVADPSKRFIYVEIAFFSRWFGEQNDATRHVVQQLVNEGRLEFILGGWCMNDEASTHYSAIIDQHKLGFEFLRKNFGDCGRPRIGWQIDPFGHSREHASIFAQFGFDGLFFGRLDYQDKWNRLNKKTMEMIWKGSPKNLGSAANLFTGVLPNGYNPPNGFCFDITCQNFNPVIKDDPKMHDYNKDQMVDDFIITVLDQSKDYASDHLIMTMGSDFNYVAAHRFFKEMDKLIKYVNAKQREGVKINVLYSTPSCYLKAVNSDNRTWTTKEDDFFPYADRAHGFWTGYFTSRPAFKYYARYVNSFYQSVKRMAALAKLDNTHGSRHQLQRLGEVLGVAQHHDGISGTAKQAVDFDYTQRLTEGFNLGQNVVSDFYQYLLSKNPEQPAPHQVFCSLLNISICNVTENAEQFQVTLFNPLTRVVNHIVRLPVKGTNYTVLDSDGVSVIPSQVVLLFDGVFRIPEKKKSGKASRRELVFEISLPPLGMKTCFAQIVKSGSPLKFVSDDLLRSENGGTRLMGERVQVDFDENGHLAAMTDVQSGMIVKLEQNFFYYKGRPGNNSAGEFQASGAYIFRPISNTPTLIGFKGWSGVRRGKVVQEVYQEFDNWVTQVIRVYKDKPYVEFEWTVGPVPVGDRIGKEVVTRYSCHDFGNNGTFYTDSNGRELLERRINYRPTWKLTQSEPVAGNYFPVNALITLKNEVTNQQFTVLTDRSQGGTSLNDGDVELMLHRRLLYDDGKGVGEALNEPGVNGRGLIVRGKHYVLLSTITEAPKLYRTIAQEVFLQPQMTFSAESTTPKIWTVMYNTEWSGLRTALPPNVHLLTMEQFLHDGPVPSPHGSVAYLIRFEHFYEVDEDHILSQPVTFDIENVFQPFNITSVHELALGANIAIEDVHRLNWRTADSQSWNVDQRSHISNKTTILLKPMEIVTLQINLNI